MTQKKYHQGNCTLEGHSFDEPPIWIADQQMNWIFIIEKKMKMKNWNPNFDLSLPSSLSFPTYKVMPLPE